MQKINVLKPFVLSRPPVVGQKVPTELSFSVGMQDVDDDVANHPYIKNDFADGRIETPTAAKKRAKDAAENAKAAQANAEKAQADAEAAYARIQLNHKTVAADSKISEADLNTPIGELKSRAGKDVG